MGALVPEDAGAGREGLDHDLERRGRDAGREAALADPALAEREVVREDADAAAERAPRARAEPALGRAGSTPFWSRNSVTGLPSPASADASS